MFTGHLGELTSMTDEGIQVTFHSNKQTRSMPSFQTEFSFGLTGLVVVLGVAEVVNNHPRGQLLLKVGPRLRATSAR